MHGESPVCVVCLFLYICCAMFVYVCVLHLHTCIGEGGLGVVLFSYCCMALSACVERMGNYKEAIKIILSRAEYGEEAVAEAVCGRDGGGEREDRRKGRGRSRKRGRMKRS